MPRLLRPTTSILFGCLLTFLLVLPHLSLTHTHADSSLLETELSSELDAELAEGVDLDTSSAVQLPGYREQIAQQLRFFAQATYCSVNSVTAWSCPVCAQGSLAHFKLTHKFFDSNTNTFGYAGLAPAAGENIIVFSFRGATPTAGRNWITDLNSQRMPYPGLKGASVHKGFYNSYLSIARTINLAAKSLLANCEGCHIYVTGHSLGGAIATLAAADLYSLTPDITLYTFGSPRVGDQKFATYIDKILPDTYRIVHDKDLVPHIPQRFLGFRHVSREVWYYANEGGKYKMCTGGEDDSCSNSIALHVDENSIKDHASYLDQPMGCRPNDLSRMGLISLLEEQTEVVPSQPMNKLKSQYFDGDSHVSSNEQEEALVEVSTTNTNTKSDTSNALDELDALKTAKADRLRLSDGVEVFPARVLDPLSKPGIRTLENIFHKVQTTWSKLPVSWNPNIKEETAEERWNRKYPEPKD